jgi:hypothetical protein
MSDTIWGAPTSLKSRDVQTGTFLTKVSSTDKEIASPLSSEINRFTFLAGTRPTFSELVVFVSGLGGGISGRGSLFFREITFFSDLTACGNNRIFILCLTGEPALTFPTQL